MKILDLFAGLRGWSDPFAAAGHDVFTIDIDTRFPRIDWYTDILDIDPSDILRRFGRPDVILASPPCTAFTTMTMGRNWTYSGEPKTETARLGRDMFLHTYMLIRHLQPTGWVIENPRARLRTLPFAPDIALPGAERVTVWYCRYGERRAKPTDLWGGFPASWVPEPPCHNGNPDHDAAPRGSTSGTQGTRSDIAAKIPFALADSLRVAFDASL